MKARTTVKATGQLDKAREPDFAQNGSSVRPQPEVMAAWDDEGEGEENRFGEEGWPARSSGDNAEEQKENYEEMDIRVRNAPRMPTKEERKTHEATHTPFKDWCPDCVRARTRSTPHRHNKSKQRVMRVHMDYFFGTVDGEDQTKENPILVIGEELRGNKMARQTNSTGLSGNEWLIKEIITELKDWGYCGQLEDLLVFKSDGASDTRSQGRGDEGV